MTILVTGVGAIIGYGILRSIRRVWPDVKLIGADINADAVGAAWSDVFVQPPRSDDLAYPIWLRQAVSRHGVRLLIPGIEQDAFGLFDLPVAERPSCAMALNSAPTIAVARDKALLQSVLAEMRDEAGIPTAESGSFDELVGRFGLPFIVKRRRSYAGKHQLTVRCRADFERQGAALDPSCIAQLHVGSDEEEYTVGTFGDGDGGVRALIILRRRLAADGSTRSATVASPDGLEAAVRRLALRFRPLGPTNFQFRRHAEAWKLLEINARISSSTSIRTAFGYNDATMCLDYYLHGIWPTQPVIRPGQVKRYIEDHIEYA